MEAGRSVSYSGQGFSLKGDKERFVLPALFRKAVRESSQNRNVLALAKHDRWPCLIGFGLSRVVQLEAQLDREEALAAQSGREFDRDLRGFQLFDFTETGFDDSGRFIIPAHLRKLGQIDGALYLQGAGAFFTLWSPEVLMAQEGPQWASAQAACASLIEGGK
ncbi:MAG: division/cell wall cluster transcriptional repressor MraZ [Proteobacteria bacterium]|nr:division/cell wall cluster transcriptional repressor MraZ [Pseudomonadota bacterium]